MRRHITLVITVLTAALMLPTLVSAQVKVSGYVQGRFTSVSPNPDLNDITKYGLKTANQATHTFGIRRARVAVKAQLDANTEAQVEFDATKTNLELKKAYVGYDLSDLNLYTRLGRTTAPFGYENQVSSSALTALERSMVTNALVPEYATGLFVTPRIEGLPGVKINMALCNTQETNNLANDNDIAILVNAEKSFAMNTARIGASYGTDGAGHTAANVYAQAELNKFGIVGEYVSADMNAAFVPQANLRYGYYGALTYSAGDTTQYFGRYDTLGSTAAGSTDTNRGTVGVNLFVNPNAKFTVEYQMIQNDPNVNNAVGAQFQVKY